mmetsp:Transcript_18471/g.61868  ORF Transcript_18471/g.61868 Transcript_18471/m.61868 type:complete len:228 (-) Transcript_18471:65-748(-)
MFGGGTTCTRRAPITLLVPAMRSPRASERGARGKGLGRLLREGLVRRVGLPRDGDHALPGAAHGVHPAGGVLHEGADRQEHDTVVAQAHGEGRVASHGAVDGVLGEEQAVHGIARVGLDRADHVGWVDVLDRNRGALFVKVLAQLVLEPDAELRELAVAALVDGGRLAEDLLARALGDDDDRVALLLEHVVQVREAPLGALGDHRHLRDQAEVHLAVAEGGVHGDEA